MLDALREHGPLPTRFFEGGGGGGMWNWKPEKRILEDLFAAGEVVVAGRESFQRLYALPEQVIPPEYRDAPPCPRRTSSSAATRCAPSQAAAR